MKKKFRELIYSSQDWRYTNRHTGRLYKLYVMQG
jgi:hypothetical protein